MSSIVSTIYYVSFHKDESDDQLRLVSLKAQVFEFSLPLYFFLMISVTLAFSALSFYNSLRDLLYPSIKEEEQANEKWHEKLNLDTRFFCILGSVVFFLGVFCFITVAQKVPDSDTGELFSPMEKVLLYGCVAILYLF